jgi:hypothetical protein
MGEMLAETGNRGSGYFAKVRFGSKGDLRVKRRAALLIQGINIRKWGLYDGRQWLIHTIIAWNKGAN